MNIHNRNIIEKKRARRSLAIVQKVLYLYTGLSVMMTVVSAVRDYTRHRLDMNKITGYAFIVLTSVVCFIYLLKGLVSENNDYNKDAEIIDIRCNDNKENNYD